MAESHSYGIVVDAGSSSSKVHLFHWPQHDGDPTKLLTIKPVVDEFGDSQIKKVEPGESKREGEGRERTRERERREIGGERENEREGERERELEREREREEGRERERERERREREGERKGATREGDLKHLAF